MNPIAKAVLVLVVLLVAATNFYMGWRLGRSSKPTAQVAITQQAAPLPPVPKKRTYPPGYNHALYTHGATITGGRNALMIIDGVATGYDWYSGFGYSCWTTNPPEPFLITLREPVEIDCVRFLLWDGDDRFQRYKLEVCADEKAEHWIVAADRSGPNEQCRGWQTIRFQPQMVKLIRLTGTFNSYNPSFYVVELQASLGMPSESQPIEQTAEF
ncbi:MAG TPA: hypothetical protein VGP72_09370 [Planctomycetota bacterium]|jgi:hypothetical protein